MSYCEPALIVVRAGQHVNKTSKGIIAQKVLAMTNTRVCVAELMAFPSGTRMQGSMSDSSARGA